MEHGIKLDEIDRQILDLLIENTRIPFTDIAKKLLVSAGTVHVRVKKMEDAIKLTFDDVLIRPKRSTLISRSEVHLDRELKFRHKS